MKTLEDDLAERARFDRERKQLRVALRALVRWYDSGDDDSRPWKRARRALAATRDKPTNVPVVKGSR